MRLMSFSPSLIADVFYHQEGRSGGGGGDKEVSVLRSVWMKGHRTQEFMPVIGRECLI